MSTGLSYTSSNIENGLTFDDLIGKLLAFNPEKWGYSEQDYNDISTQFLVSSNNIYHLPDGNYRIKNLPNSPFTDEEYVNLSVGHSDSKKFYICKNGSYKKYYCELESESQANWIDISNSIDGTTDMMLFSISSVAPLDTTVIWIDTSSLDTEDMIYLKLYHNGSWVTYKTDAILDKDKYDTTNQSTDIFKLIDERISKYSLEFASAISHINNELTLIHISSSTKNYFNTYLLTSDQIASLLDPSGDIYKELIAYITTTVGAKTGIDTSTRLSNELINNIENHLDDHITSDDINRWDNKASGDHTHIYDDSVIVSVSNINVSNTSTFPSTQAQLSTERICKLDSFDILENSVSDTDLNSKYHNGNTLYIENASGTTTWMKIVDNSKFGTSDYMSGLLQLSAITEDVPFNKISNHPTTLAGYGIVDGVTTDIMNREISSLDKSFTPDGYYTENNDEDEIYIGIQKTLRSSGGGSLQYPMSTEDSDLDIIMVRISPNIDNDLSHYNVDKFNCQTTGGDGDPSYYKLSYCAPGLSKHKTLMPADLYFYNLYSKDSSNPKWSTDGLGRMIKVNTATDNTIINEVFTINGNAYTVIIRFIYGTGIVFEITAIDSVSSPSKILKNLNDQISPISNEISRLMTTLKGEAGIVAVGRTAITNREWQSVCYGNGRFIAIAKNTNVFAHSTNGISWTEGTISDVSREWQAVCYGNGRFVAIAKNTNVFAYSNDGITWIEGTIGVDNIEWQHVCYGNDKFVAITKNSIVFAYSNDGITWTETTLASSSRTWQCVCYGNGKFVAVEVDNSLAAYSSDGITWRTSSIGSTKPWQSVCYGNDKFVAIAKNSNMISYSLNGTSWRLSTMSSSKAWKSICYGNGKFVVIATNSNVFAYSVDGITWAESTMGSTSRPYTNICHGGKRYVAVSESEGVATFY